MKEIISWDVMKLQKDVIGSEPSQTLIHNIIQTVFQNFPRTTHIAVSVPINTNGDFAAHGTIASPLTVEAFTQLWMDEIHNAGYNVLLRGTACEFEGIWNFPLTAKTGAQWTVQGIDFLNRMKSHLKSGDICGLYPEFDSTLFGRQFQSINDGTGNAGQDANNFLLNFSQAILDWSNANGIDVHPYITVNRSEMFKGYIGQSVWQKMGAVVYDFYGFNQTLAEMPGLIDEAYNKYNIPIFQQEWGDTRPAGVVAADPGFTANMADTAFFPKMQAGHMIGINFWNLFDTPQEGILTISGDNVTLNAKGNMLAAVFAKWAQSTPTPTPTPQPVPQPAPQPVPTPTPAPVLTRLGGLDINSFCVKSSNGTALVSQGTWDCSGDQKPVDLSVVCRLQYSNPQAFAKQDIVNNPYSWSCYLGTQPAPAPQPMPVPPVPPFPVFSYIGSVQIDSNGTAVTIRAV